MTTSSGSGTSGSHLMEVHEPSNPAREERNVLASLVQHELLEMAQAHCVFGLIVGDADQMVRLLRDVHVFHQSSSSSSREENREERWPHTGNVSVPDDSERKGPRANEDEDNVWKREAPHPTSTPRQDPLQGIVRCALLSVRQEAQRKQQQEEQAWRERNAQEDAGHPVGADGLQGATATPPPTSSSSPFKTYVHWLWGTNKWSTTTITGMSNPSASASFVSYYGIVFVAVNPMVEEWYTTPSSSYTAPPEEAEEPVPATDPSFPGITRHGSPSTGRRDSSLSGSSSMERDSKGYTSLSLPEVSYYIAAVVELGRDAVIV